MLITGALCLLFFANAVKAQDMQKKISLNIEKATLADVLNQLKEQYGLRFSYLNNDLWADTVYNYQVQDAPLDQVLDNLLEKCEAGYKYHNGQIIIKKGLPKPVPAKESQKPKEAVNNSVPEDEAKVNSSASPKSPKIAQAGTEQANETSGTAGDEGSLGISEAEGKKEAALPEEKEELKEQTTGTATESRSIVQGNEEGVTEDNNFESSAGLATTPAPQEAITRPKPSEDRKENNISAFWQKMPFSAGYESDTIVSDFHLGIFYPLSTHGTAAPQHVNKFSAHLLVGVAAGLEGVELSSIGNIEKNYVKGYQFAGVFNLVANDVQGLQVSGFINKNGGKAEGGQVAGFMNYAGAKVWGVQAAGFMNRAGSLEGTQLAGFMNTTGDVEGVQAAGFLNKAKEVEGAQIAGFYNTAENVKGVQAAGFINRARNVKGFQIAVFNFADSVSGGVPIGFLSFVKNGYRAFEVYSGEDFHANVNFKIGVRKFYNILAAGIEVNGNQRSGFGYGVGSEWRLNQRFYLTTDAISYGVNEKSFTDNIRIGSADDQQINILNKLRVLLTWQPGSRFAMFGGPTYNIMVSRYQENPEGPVGSDLVRNTFFDRTNRNTNVKMWIGFNAGIRF